VDYICFLCCMLIFVFFLVEVTEVRDVLQPTESICVSKTIAMQKQKHVRAQLHLCCSLVGL